MYISTRTVILALPVLGMALGAPAPAPIPAAVEARAGFNLGNGFLSSAVSQIFGGLIPSSTAGIPAINAAAAITASASASVSTDPYKKIQPIIADLSTAADTFLSTLNTHMCTECSSNLRQIDSSIERAFNLITDLSDSGSYTAVTTSELNTLAGNMAKIITEVATGLTEIRLIGNIGDSNNVFPRQQAQMITAIDVQMADLIAALDVLASKLSSTTAPFVYVIMEASKKFLPKTNGALGMS